MEEIRAKLNFNSTSSPLVVRSSYAKVSPPSNRRLTNYHLSRQDPAVLDRLYDSDVYKPRNTIMPVAPPTMTPHPPTSVMRPPADSVVRAVVRSTQFRSFTSQTSPVLVKLAPPTIKKSEETDDIMMTSVDPCSKSAVVSALKAKRKRWWSSVGISPNGEMSLSKKPRTTAVIDYTSSSVGNSNKRPLNVSLSSDAKKTKLTPRPNRLMLPVIEVSPLPSPVEGCGTVEDIALERKRKDDSHESNEAKKRRPTPPIDEDEHKTKLKREATIVLQDKLTKVYPSPSKGSSVVRRRAPILCTTGSRPHMFAHPSHLSTTQKAIHKDKENRSNRLKSFLTSDDVEVEKPVAVVTTVAVETTSIQIDSIPLIVIPQQTTPLHPLKTTPSVSLQPLKATPLTIAATPTLSVTTPLPSFPVSATPTTLVPKPPTLPMTTPLTLQTTPISSIAINGPSFPLTSFSAPNLTSVLPPVVTTVTTVQTPPIFNVNPVVTPSSTLGLQMGTTTMSLGGVVTQSRQPLPTMSLGCVVTQSRQPLPTMSLGGVVTQSRRPLPTMSLGGVVTQSRQPLPTMSLGGVVTQSRQPLPTMSLGGVVAQPLPSNTAGNNNLFNFSMTPPITTMATPLAVMTTPASMTAAPSSLTSFKFGVQSGGTTTTIDPSSLTNLFGVQSGGNPLTTTASSTNGLGSPFKLQLNMPSQSSSGVQPFQFGNTAAAAANSTSMGSSQLGGNAGMGVAANPFNIPNTNTAATNTGGGGGFNFSLSQQPQNVFGSNSANNSHVTFGASNVTKATLPTSQPANQNSMFQFGGISNSKPAANMFTENPSGPANTFQFQSPSMGGAKFQSPSVGGATFQTSSMGGARFQSPSLVGAKFQSSSVGGAQFQSSSVGGAQFQSSSVGGAQFQSSSVGGAQFQSSVGGAKFQSPSLVGAKFQTPSVGVAQFQTPSMGGAQFQSSSVGGAPFQTPSQGFSFSANPSTGGVVNFAAGTGKPRSTVQGRRRTKK